MLKRTGALVVLVSLYLIASAIGSTFGEALKVFSFLVWIVAFGMLVYLLLFRGMKIDIAKVFDFSGNSDAGDDAHSRAEENAGNDNEDRPQR